MTADNMLEGTSEDTPKMQNLEETYRKAIQGNAERFREKGGTEVTFYALALANYATSLDAIPVGEISSNATIMKVLGQMLKEELAKVIEVRDN